jgi:hypothetical protein
MRLIKLMIVTTLLVSCSWAVSDSSRIVDFETCVSAGNKVLRSYPAKCVAPGVGIFTQVLEPSAQPKRADPLRLDSFCKDLCGDGVCEEIVCLAQGCPCVENKEKCPKDCK